MHDNEFQDHSDVEHDPAECTAILEFHCDGENSMRIPIPAIHTSQELLIGRESKCNWVIVDNRVSKQHFRIYTIIYEKDVLHSVPPLVYCEDLESLNGTYVNGRLIGRISQERIGHLLCDGDLIEIKPLWKFRFHQTMHECVTRNPREQDDLMHFHDHYAVTDRKLGGGKYGSVYLAKEVSTTRQVACKIINLQLPVQRLSPSQCPSSVSKRWQAGVQVGGEEKMRAMREIKILATVSHPNIINLRKAFCSHDALYIFTDLATAGDLFSYTQSHGGSLDDYQTRVITRQVALAVQFLHSRDIAHRDIKQENILVTDTHFGGRAILTDFGFATQINTRTGRMMSKLGTDGYLAPEVGAVEETNVGYKKAADLWSLGILTATMLTGTMLTGNLVVPPEELAELSQVEIAARYLGMDNEHARAQWRRIPPRALEFIRRLLVVDPDNRITIDEALDHPWYSTPPREAEALTQALRRINQFWKPREKDDEIIQTIPGVILNTASSQKPPLTKSRKKVPDTSLSAYFSLDRHLVQRTQSTRKRILEDLTESGSQFIAAQVPEMKLSRTDAGNFKDRGASEVILVGGEDLFGTSFGTWSTTQVEPCLAEVDHIPTTPTPRSGRDFGSDLSDPLIPPRIPPIMPRAYACAHPGRDPTVLRRPRRTGRNSIR